MRTLNTILIFSLQILIGGSMFANISLVNITPSESGANNGSIQIIAEGDAGPFTVYLEDLSGITVLRDDGTPIEYTNVNGRLTIEGVPPGTYRIRVVDFLECEEFLDVLVPEMMPECAFSVDVLDIQHISECRDKKCGTPQNPAPDRGCTNDGRIEIRVNSESPDNYEISWIRVNDETVIGRTEILRNIHPLKYRLEVRSTIDDEECPPFIQEFEITVCCDIIYTGDIKSGSAPSDKDIPDGCKLANVGPIASRIVKDIKTTGSRSATDCTGKIDATLKAGDDYIFYWENDDTGERYNTEDLENLCPGKYCLEIDAGCGEPGRSCVDIIDCSLNPVEITFVSRTNTCPGVSFGILDINVQGGNGDYEYQWSNGSSTQDLNDVAAGTYTIVVTDGEGCTAEADYVILDSNPIELRNFSTPTCRTERWCNDRFDIVLDEVPYEYFQSSLTADCRYSDLFCSITQEFAYRAIREDWETVFPANISDCTIDALCPRGRGVVEVGVGIEERVCFSGNDLLVPTNDGIFIANCDVTYCYFNSGEIIRELGVPFSVVSFVRDVPPVSISPGAVFGCPTGQDLFRIQDFCRSGDPVIFEDCFSPSDPSRPRNGRCNQFGLSFMTAHPGRLRFGLGNIQTPGDEFKAETYLTSDYQSLSKKYNNESGLKFYEEGNEKVEIFSVTDDFVFVQIFSDQIGVCQVKVLGSLNEVIHVQDEQLSNGINLIKIPYRNFGSYSVHVVLPNRKILKN